MKLSKILLEQDEFKLERDSLKKELISKFGNLNSFY